MVFVDARPSEAYETARIPGAVSLRLGDLPQPTKRRNRASDPRLTRAGRILVYGDDPGDFAARAVAKRLIALGYDDVSWLEAGIEGWRSSGGRVVRGAPQGDDASP